MSGQKFELSGIIEHWGYSRRGGHYLTSINYDGSTYRIDDEVVCIRNLMQYNSFPSYAVVMEWTAYIARFYNA